MSNKEIVELKNEFLKEIREIEMKLNHKLDIYSLQLESNNKIQEDKLNNTYQKNELLYDRMLNQKIQVEKISEIYISQKRLNDILNSHEVRINTLIKENKKLTKIQDKIITDNLMVTGYIGENCTYKNLSEYIQHNINEVQKLKSEKEMNKKLADEIKMKVDIFMKNMLSLVDNTFTRCKQYTDNKHIYLENILNSKLVEFNDKNMDLRTQIFTNFSKIEHKVEAFGNKIEDELRNIREKADKEVEKSLKELKNDIQKVLSELQKNNIDDMLNYKISITQLIDQKFEEFNKKNKKKIEFRLKKSDNNVLSPNIKAFKESYKKPEFTYTSNIRKTQRISNEKFKRDFIMSSKELLNKNFFGAKEDKEENKTFVEMDHNRDESIHNFDENNMIKTTYLLKEEESNNEKEKEESNEKEKEKKDNMKKLIDNIKDLKLDNTNNNETTTQQNEKIKDSIIKLENLNNDLSMQQNEKSNNDNNKSDNINNEIPVQENIIKSKINNDNKQTIDNEDSSFNLSSKNINNIINVNSDSNCNCNSPIKSYNCGAKKYRETNNPEINEKNNNTANTIIEEKSKIKLKKYGNIKHNEHEELNKNLYQKNYIETRNKKKFNYNQSLKEEGRGKKKRDLKMNSVDKVLSLFENNNNKNNSPQQSSIETQTKNKNKDKFPKIGFNYRIIQLGSDIYFNENELELIQKIREQSTNKYINLASPLTNTYKTYQKKKKEKKNILQMSLKELPLKGTYIKQNNNISSFYNTSTNNSFYHKKKFKSIDYDYVNLRK